METPKDQLIEMYYRRIQAMEFKINQLRRESFSFWGFRK